jgi:flagellar basal body-associated protein FliL
MDTIIAVILVIIIVGIEVAGIWYVNKINSKPEEDFKDWDITLMDGLEEEEQQEKQP